MNAIILHALAVKKLPENSEMVWCTKICLVAHLTWNDPCAKTAEPNVMPFELWAGIGPRNPVVMGSTSPMGKGNFWGKGRP